MEKSTIQSLSQLLSKRYLLFFIASSALVSAGYIVSNALSLKAFILVLWCNLFGIFLIYRMNDCFEQSVGFWENVRNFFSDRFHLLISLQFVAVVIPLAILWLPKTVIVTLAIMAFAGALYCINIKIGKSQFRLKNFFLVKNILIGASWGALILIGGAVTNDPLLMRFFFIAAAQVTIGGIIRDIPDAVYDQNHGVRTLPVVLGVDQTIRLLHLFNAAQLILAIHFPIEPGLITFTFVVISWRTTNLHLLKKNPANKFYSQWMNISTCVVILLTLLILNWYGTL